MMLQLLAGRPSRERRRACARVIYFCCAQQESRCEPSCRLTWSSEGASYAVATFVVAAAAVKGTHSLSEHSDARCAVRISTAENQPVRRTGDAFQIIRVPE